MSNKLENERTMTNRELFKKLFHYLKPELGKFLVAILMLMISVGCSLVIPLLNGETIKVMGKPIVEYDAIVKIALMFVGISVIAFGAEYTQAMMLQHAGQSIIYTVRMDVFRHLEYTSIEQINQIPIGKLVTRVTNDTNALNELFTDVLINLLKSLVTLVGVIIFMFINNVKLASYMVTLMPFILVMTFAFNFWTRKAYRKVRKNLSEINASLSENLSGMKITQVFNAEEKQYKEFKERNERLRKSNLKQILLFAIFRPTIYVCYLGTVIIVFWFGGKEALIANDLEAIAALVVFEMYINSFFNPIQQLSEQLNILQSSLASSERIFEILDTESNIQDYEDAIELDELKGEIEFKNVWFAYEGENWILKDVSFHIKPREVVAFVGATGSGKTTILSLIVRNYDIQKGQILIDGIDVKKIKLASLRKHFGQMLQDVFLFSGDIMDNIKMQEESITDEEVYSACKYVGADHFIEKLDDKYHEKVRERGNNFSSGQRQLLSFARTIVHKPSVIILDEATANIDTETEVLIQESLEKIMHIGTTLMVAHRLSTIQHSDKIIVLSKGVIIEEGTHQELLKQKGQYYKLYTLQYEKKQFE